MKKEVTKTDESKKPTLRPLHDRVIIKRDPPDETKGLIILLEGSQEKKQFGTVIAIGKGRTSDMTNEVRPMDIKPGDRVVFGQYTGDPFKIGEEEFLMIREDAIYAVVEECVEE